jgi:hypothetical protein
MRRRVVMMNPIGIRNEDRIGSRGRWFADSHDRDLGPRARWSGSGRWYEGWEVGVGETAERYWKELRPSSAGRFRLEVTIRPDREHPGRHPRRRPRQHVRPKLRTTSR